MRIMESIYGIWAHCKNCDATLIVRSAFCRHCGMQVTGNWDLRDDWNIFKRVRQ